MTGPEGTRLHRSRRTRERDQVAAGLVCDVLVVGGGVTGAGVALDAASRGLTVVLCERRDLAAGTSGFSSKLVHGGLRYLATGEVGLALDSARERDTLLRRTAGHLVRPLPMALPLTPDVDHRRAAAMMAAAHLADGLARLAGTPARLLPRSRRLGVPETRRLLPTLRPDGVRGALLHWDGQLEDDARLVVALARTAAGHGARILTRARVTELDATGAQVADDLDGGGFTVRARAVVNATGVWAGELAPEIALRPSKGSHLVLPASALGRPAAAMTVPVPGEGNRFVFALPQPDDVVLVGLTDDEVPAVGPDPLEVGAAERELLLGTLSRALDRQLGPDDVIGSFAGVRPLLAGPRGRTADLSRRHAVVRDSRGVWSVVGGKLTTYRQMAQDVVDRLTGAPCRTRDLPLVGAAPLPPAEAAALPRRLVRRYGAEAAQVAACAGGDPELLRPVAEGVAVLGVELRFGVSHEGALDAADLLQRRTRLSLVPAWARAARPAAEAALAPARV